MTLAQSHQPAPRPDWNDQWKTGEEARRYADKQAAAAVKTIPGLLERMHVKMEASTMGNVKVHVITPDEVTGQNRNRVLIHVHGGCYVLFPGESGTTEAIMMSFAIAKELDDIAEYDLAFRYLKQGCHRQRRMFTYSVEEDIAVIDRLIQLRP
jgi:acetyl esterase/lipase